MPLSFLVVDDSASIRLHATKMLAHEGVPEENLHEAPTAEDGIETFHEVEPDVVLMDIDLPGMDCDEAAAELQSLDAEVKIVIITGSSEDDERVRGAVKQGAFEVVHKPIRHEEVARLLRLLSDESEGVQRIR